MSDGAILWAARLARLQAAMADASVALTAVAPTDNLRWLLGFSPHADERLCLLLVSAEHVAMAVPALNAEEVAARADGLELHRWADEQGPASALRAALTAVGVGGSASVIQIAADAEMRADHLLALQAALPAATTLDGAELLAPLRAVKDTDELARLRASAAVADDAVRAAWAAIAPGVSEREVNEAIAAAFSAGGARPEFGIVGGGPHSAFPHHATGERPLQAGEPVLTDIGARLDGYYSDITRMAFLGEPTDRYREVHAVVEAAVSAGIAAARPGVTCGEVDAAARAVITDAGFGASFTHRAGHGLGLSIHEQPWVMAGSEVPLQAGMVHSVEPGIYLPGEFGIRLEDIVVIGEDGAQRLSALPRDVHVVSL
jgi:Xaa-Pro aminopeptidase